MPTKVTRPPLPGQSRRQQGYPHVSAIPDAPTQATIALLWERLLSMQTAHDAAVSTVEALTTRVRTAEEGLATAAANAESALLTAGKATSSSNNAPVGSGGGAPPPPGGGPGEGPGTDTSWDGGQGQAGLNNAPATGHLPVSVTPNLYNVGQIVGGVTHEFPALLAPTVDLATRRANVLQLRLRIIWHLLHVGYLAGQNKNPSGATGIDSIVVQVDGNWRGYDIISSQTYSDFTRQGDVMMLPMEPQETTYIPDGGIPD